MLCSLLSTMLYTKNVQVVCAHSIAEADNYMNAGTLPSVIFLDQLLPDGNGIDFLTRIKTHYAKIKVIMMSGQDDETMVNRAVSNGCFAFLEKPFSYRNVAELLDKALRKKKLLFRLV